MKFSIKDFFSKCDQMENFIFCTVAVATGLCEPQHIKLEAIVSNIAGLIWKTVASAEFIQLGKFSDY